jgi:hypothetical protein
MAMIASGKSHRPRGPAFMHLESHIVLLRGALKIYLRMFLNKNLD